MKLSSKIRTRRGRGKKPALKCTFLYSNINGFKGKSASFEEILMKIQPTIVVLSEIRLANVDKIKEVMGGYEPPIDRCIKQGKGGGTYFCKTQHFWLIH